VPKEELNVIPVFGVVILEKMRARTPFGYLTAFPIKKFVILTFHKTYINTINGIVLCQLVSLSFGNNVKRPLKLKT